MDEALESARRAATRASDSMRNFKNGRMLDIEEARFKYFGGSSSSTAPPPKSNSSWYGDYTGQNQQNQPRTINITGSSGTRNGSKQQSPQRRRLETAMWGVLG